MTGRKTVGRPRAKGLGSADAESTLSIPQLFIQRFRFQSLDAYDDLGEDVTLDRLLADAENSNYENHRIQEGIQEERPKCDVLQKTV